MSEEKEFDPKTKSAVGVAKKVFAETGIEPKPNWEKYVENSIKEGPDGQTKLLMMLAKPLADSEKSSLPGVKEAATTISGNAQNPEARRNDRFGDRMVTLTNLKHGPNTLPAQAVHHIFDRLGAKFEPGKQVLNDGSRVASQASFSDEVAITFDYLPQIALRVNVKHSDRNKTDGNFVDKRMQTEAIFDKNSTVTELTAVPILEQTSSDDLPDLW